MGMTPLEISGEKKLDPKIRNELSDLMLMMDNWKNGYRSWCNDGEDNEWVMREFTAEVQEMLQPYMMALYARAGVEYSLCGSIIMFAYDKIDELRKEFKAKEQYTEWV